MKHLLTYSAIFATAMVIAGCAKEPTAPDPSTVELPISEPEIGVTEGLSTDVRETDAGVEPALDLTADFPAVEETEPTSKPSIFKSLGRAVVGGFASTDDDQAVDSP